MKKKLVVLAGPTAVGKTELSIQLAKTVRGEIISADSMQVYKHLDIGSAKIMPDEMQGVTHYLVDCLEPDVNFNVSMFQNMTKNAMGEIYSRNHIPIIVGGTGFYTQSVIYDIDFGKNEVDPQIRAAIDAEAAQKGAAYMHEKLKKVDPESAESIPAANVKRVCRALEYYESTGKKISDHNKEERQKSSPYDCNYFVLNLPREILYQRIEDRVDRMMEMGLLDEVKKCLAIGCTRDMNSMQGLGYKQLIRYIYGECSLDQAIEDIKKETRHFAKRQLTWFRRERDVIWINKNEFSSNSEIVEFMEGIIKNGNK